MPGQGVEGRQRCDSAERAGENAGEETDGLRQCFGTAIGLGDKEGGAAQLVRDVSRNQSFGHVVKAGDGDVVSARAQGRERAFHRRMAQHTL